MNCGWAKGQVHQTEHNTSVWVNSGWMAREPHTSSAGPTTLSVAGDPHGHCEDALGKGFYGLAFFYTTTHVLVEDIQPGLLPSALHPSLVPISGATPAPGKPAAFPCQPASPFRGAGRLFFHSLPPRDTPKAYLPADSAVKGEGYVCSLPRELFSTPGSSRGSAQGRGVPLKCCLSRPVSGRWRH